MGVTAILVMWPGPFEQTSIPASIGFPISNFSLINPVVSEEKMVENVDRWTDGQMPEWLVYF